MIFFVFVFSYLNNNDLKISITIFRKNFLLFSANSYFVNDFIIISTQHEQIIRFFFFLEHDCMHSFRLKNIFRAFSPDRVMT